MAKTTEKISIGTDEIKYEELAKNKEGYTAKGSGTKNLFLISICCDPLTICLIQAM